MTATAKIGGFGLSVGLALALTACGGDTPEAVQGALQQAAPTLAYVDNDEGPCVADTMFAEVGFDQLALEGHTSESISLDPTGSIRTIFETHDSPALRTAITGCLDANGRFRTALSEQHLTDPVQCEAPFTTDEPLVDEYMNATIDGESPTIDLEDDEATRDLLRPCTTENDFSDIFGLTTSADLAIAIDAVLGDKLREDEAPCGGAPIVDAVGYEALNTLGIDADVVRVEIDELGLDDEALEALTQELAQCSDFSERAATNYRTAEPYFGPCILEVIAEDEDWLTSKVEHAVGLALTERTAERVESTAIRDCWEERSVELFGELEWSERTAAKAFGTALYDALQEDDFGKYGTTAAEYNCMTYGLFYEIGSDEVYAATEDLYELDDTTEAFWKAYDTIWGRLGELKRECVGDWLTIAGDYERAGFSDETLECVKDSVDVEGTAEVFTRRTFDLSWEEWDAYTFELDAAVIVLEDALTDCYTEEDQSMYDKYNDWIDDVNDTEDDEFLNA